MTHIDEIIDIISDKGELTLDEISDEINVPTDEISSILREAEINGLIFRTTNKNKEVYKL